VRRRTLLLDCGRSRQHPVDGGAAGRVIEVPEPFPEGLRDPVDAPAAAHGGHGVVHYWHLLK
jgi:hypothetical protein